MADAPVHHDIQCNLGYLGWCAYQLHPQVHLAFPCGFDQRSRDTIDPHFDLVRKWRRQEADRGQYALYYAAVCHILEHVHT
jgi:hypothetical protein